MFGKSKPKIGLGGGGNGSSRNVTTSRKDWDDLIVELYTGVVAGTPFGIGVVAPVKGLLGASMKLRLNLTFPSQQVVNFIRKNFNQKRFEKVFHNDAGLTPDSISGVMKITSDDTGLPRNCLIMRFENESDRTLRGMILFGGERMEGQLEKRVERARNILAGKGAKGTLPTTDVGALMGKLDKLNTKRISEHSIEELSSIVNGLQEHRDSMSKDQKNRFKIASDYILKRRLR